MSEVTPPNQPKYEWLRWIALPFAAFLGAGVASVVSVYFWWLPQKFFGGWNESGACFQYILPCISSAIFGGAFVSISFKVAPRGKAVAGLVMTTIMCVLLLLSHIVLVIRADDTTGEKVFLSINVLITITSAIITLKNLYNDLDWTQTK